MCTTNHEPKGLLRLALDATQSLEKKIEEFAIALKNDQANRPRSNDADLRAWQTGWWSKTIEAKQAYEKVVDDVLSPVMHLIESMPDEHTMRAFDDWTSWCDEFHGTTIQQARKWTDKLYEAVAIDGKNQSPTQQELDQIQKICKEAGNKATAMMRDYS